MKKIEYLDYEQLCKKFKEDPLPKGNRRQLQKKRWEKQGYNIIWDGNLQKYEVVPLTVTELSKKMKENNERISSQSFVEPFIMWLLLDKGRLVETPQKLAHIFGLVNDVYIEVFGDENEQEKLSSTIQISSTKIQKFQETTSQINWVAIKNILSKLQDKELITWERCYEVYQYQFDENDDILRDVFGNPIISKYETDRDTTKLIQELQDKYATELKNGVKTAYYALSENDKKLVRRHVCRELGYEKYWYTNIIECNGNGMDYEFNKKFNALKSKLAINKDNHVRIANSTRGDFFKELEEKNKIKLINALIDIK